MENLVYLVVKGASAAYILYNMYRFLSGQSGKSLWCFLTPKIKTREIPVMSPAYSVIGKSQTVYLEKPTERESVVPVFSEDLQKIPAYEEDADITENDVDNNPDEEILSREERFLPLNTELDGEAVSSGMTYEQISQALDVVRGKQPDDSGRLAVARILYEIQGSDVFDFLATQAENEAMIEKLIKENIDNGGILPPENARKLRREMEKFDMKKYV
jgi:hypothetical protein